MVDFRKLILSAGWLIMLIIVPLLNGHGRLPATLESAGRARIEQMSDAERLRFQDNVKQFRTMSATERSQILEMHKLITADPELSAMLDDYAGWLRSLPTHHRQEIDDAATIADRLTKVCQLVEPKIPQRFIRIAVNNQRIELPHADFDRMMEVLARNPSPSTGDLLNQLSDSDPKAIRYAVLIGSLMPRGSFDRRSQQHRAVLRHVAPLINCVSVATVRERLRQQPVEDQLMFLRQFLIRGFLQSRDDWRRDWMPDRDDLIPLLEQLESGTRDALMELPPADATKRLRDIYIEQYGPKLPAVGGALAEELRRVLAPQRFRPNEARPNDDRPGRPGMFPGQRRPNP